MIVSIVVCAHAIVVVGRVLSGMILAENDVLVNHWSIMDCSVKPFVVCNDTNSLL